jgi:rRNA-processing protein FCF1
LLLVLDSSILMMAKPNSMNFDEIEKITGRLKLAVPKAIVEELQQLSKGKGVKAMRARFALDLIGKMGIEIIKIDTGKGDYSLLNLANRGEAIIATMDINIIENLIRRGKKVVTLRDERPVLLG